MKDVFSVEGKVTIVTGGGTGIGAVIAREFALRGAPVLIASRNAEHLGPVRDGIRKAGGKCEMAVCDVRNAESCDALVAALGLAHPEQAPLEVDVVPVEPERFAAAQPAEGEQSEHEPVAFALAREGGVARHRRAR